MKTLLLTTVAAFALSAPAFAAEKETFESKTKVEKKADGDYKETTKSSATNAAGTTTTTEKKVDVDVDSKGNVDTSVKTEVTTDPKGLMNKETTKTKDTENTKADGSVEVKHKKTVNGKTVEETEDTTKR